jgi:glycosyltransferase involved in cell wall biosynthesis
MQEVLTAPQVSIVIPVFNEEETIGDLLEKTAAVMSSTAKSFEIIVVNDGSTDRTALNAKQPGVTVINHPYNIGNGAAVKSGIRYARGQFIILMDGDGQHDPADIPRFLEKLADFDMVVGSRTDKSHRSAHRTLANHLFNWLASYICSRRIPDLTSGYRAIKTAIARRFIYLLPNTFSYPTTITLAIVRAGHSLTYIPIQTRERTGASKIRIIHDGFRFLGIIVKIATLFSPFKIFLPVSAFMFLLGLSYGLFRIFALAGSYGPTSAMLMIMAVVVFMVGLVSEQVAQLRFDRSETLPEKRESDPH